MSNLQVVNLNVTENHLLTLDNLNAVVHQLINGRFVILPTETGYLLGADALNLDAIEKIFKVKKRPLSNPIHVVVTGLKMAEDLIFLNSRARRLCNSCMPGPLTVICPKKPMVSDLLVANTGNLGIRIPDSPVVQQVIQAFGKPITATSLNVSGIPESGSLDETIMSLDWTNELLVYVVTDPDIVAFPSASTVITFATDPWQVLREGPITMEEIANAMTRPNYSDVQEWT